MKAHIISPLIYEDFIGGRYKQLQVPFKWYSVILKQVVTVPAGFICDLESVPFLRASSNRGGVGHDYFCRKDSVPVVTKQVAADLYLELQKCRDEALEESRLKRLDRLIRRNFKTLVVRVVLGYFHKYNVLATLEELEG